MVGASAAHSMYGTSDPLVGTAYKDGAPDIVYVFANQAARGLARGASGNSIVRSSDGGETFETPRMILTNTFNNQNGNVATFSDGSLITVWFEIASTGSPSLSHRRLWASVSEDGGDVFSPPRLAVDGHEGRWPVLDVDRSEGDRNDRVYAAWVRGTDTLGAVDDRVFITWSDDKGMNWTEPKPVHRRPETLHNAMMAVSPEGVVGVSWWDWDGRCTQLQFVASVDGGESFSEPEPVSPRWCPSVDRHEGRLPLPGRSGNVAERWPGGGDYHALVASRGPQFTVLWVDGSRYHPNPTNSRRPYETRPNIFCHA